MRRFNIKLNTLKNSYSKINTVLGTLFLFILLLAGCKKGDETLGIDLLPGTSTFVSRSYLEQNSITAYTFTDDKIRSDRPALSFTGSFNDPLYGRTDGSFAAQFRLPYHPDYDGSSSVDSLVLILSYKSVYGDTLNPQTLKVYELDGSLKYDAKYLSSFHPKNIASGTLLGSASFIPKFRVNTAQRDTTEQFIRIRLNPSFAEKLLAVDSLAMISNDVFLETFKGLYIEAEPVGRKGALVGIIHNSAELSMNYHTDTKDSLSFSYKISSNSAVVPGFVHDYSNSAFFSNLNKEQVQDSLLFIQPLGGTKVKVNVPSLTSWADSSDYLINKATLYFHVDTLLTDMQRFGIPSRIYLKIIDSDGDEVFPKDSELSSSYYGGYYSSESATYSFNITQHLQQIIDGEVSNTTFYLVHSDRNGIANRVVLKGGTSSLPMELLINYTRYK